MFIGHARANLWAAGEFMLMVSISIGDRSFVTRKMQTLRSALPVLEIEGIAGNFVKKKKKKNGNFFLKTFHSTI